MIILWFYFIIAFLFYVPALWFEYTVDDLGVLAQTEQKKLTKPKNKFYRWWLIFSGRAYWIEFDDDTKDDAHKKIKPNIIPRLLPILIHLGICLMIYFIFGRNKASLLAALFFAINPVNAEVAAGQIGYKGYSLTAFYVLAAWALPVLAPLVYSLQDNGFFYYTGIFAPLIYLLRPDWLNCLALLTLWTLWLKWQGIFDPQKQSKIGSFSKNKFAMGIAPQKLIVALKFYGYFLANSIFAMHTAFFQSYMDDFLTTKKGILKGIQIDRYFWIGCAGIYILITNLIWNYNLAIFGLFWATINVAMWCNFLYLGQQHIVNRYYYLANVGMVLALGVILQDYPWIAGPLLGWYARQMIYALRQYQNDFFFFFYGIVDEPKFYASWIGMGIWHYHSGCFKRAQFDFNTALELRPGNFHALYNLTSAYLARFDFVNAAKYLELANQADVYGQEDRARQKLIERFNLFERMRRNPKAMWSTKDIDVVTP